MQITSWHYALTSVYHNVAFSKSRNRDVFVRNPLIKCDFSVIWQIKPCIRAPVLLNLLNSLGIKWKVLPSYPSCDHLGQTLYKLSILECNENN